MSDAARALARRLIPRGVRNWLRSPARTAAWVRDELRHGLGFDTVAQLRPDWSVCCHPGAYRLAYAPYLIDAAQAAELDGFVATCRPGMVLYDLGAHFGVFSLAALHYGGETSRAIAVEPSPGACRILRIQAALNGGSRRIAVVQAAAASVTGRRAMVPIGVIAAGYYSGATAGYGKADLTDVRAVSLDDLVAEYGTWPTHIKIDVEGAEADVLRGARRTLTGAHPPVMFVELHNEMVRRQGHDPAQATALLRELGYALQGAAGAPLTDDQAVLGEPLVRVVGRRTA